MPIFPPSLNRLRVKPFCTGRACYPQVFPFQGFRSGIGAVPGHRPGPSPTAITRTT